MVMHCRRCPRTLVECDTCEGKGEIFGIPIIASPCTECAGTGYQCPRDGKHWK